MALKMFSFYIVESFLTEMALCVTLDDMFEQSVEKWKILYTFMDAFTGRV